MSRASCSPTPISGMAVSCFKLCGCRTQRISRSVSPVLRNPRAKPSRRSDSPSHAAKSARPDDQEREAERNPHGEAGELLIVELADGERGVAAGYIG
jgi:hypothetical protein